MNLKIYYCVTVCVFVFLCSVRGYLKKKSDKETKKKKKMKLTLKLKVKAKEMEEEKDEKKCSLNFTISKSQLSSPASSTLTTENSGVQRAKFISLLSKFPEITKVKVVIIFPNIISLNVTVIC